MYDKTSYQHYFNRPYNGVGAHKVSPMRKDNSAIVDKNQSVDGAVNDQKANQKQSGKGHDYLFAD